MASSDPYEKPDYLVRECQGAKDTGDENTFPYDLNLVTDDSVGQNTIRIRPRPLKR